jgi:hypothetical protein
LISSAVSLVMRAEDDTLYVIGLSEIDKNFHPIPLVVHQPSSKASKSSEKSIGEPVKLPAPAKLKRGHVRVSVIYPKEQTAESSKQPFIENEEIYSLEAHHFRISRLNPVYDIVLSDGRASMVAVDDLIFQNSQGSVSADDIDPYGNYSIVDYSYGWQHSLIAIQEQGS